MSSFLLKLLSMAVLIRETNWCSIFKTVIKCSQNVTEHAIYVPNRQNESELSRIFSHDMPTMAVLPKILKLLQP